MLEVGIIGAAGYTAGELLRLLIFRKDVHLRFAQSASHSGEPLWKAHEDLLGVTDMCFSGEEDSDPTTCDVIFLCSGHGRSKGYVHAIADSYKGAIIDLSNDFRLEADKEDFTYGLVEAFKDEILSSKSRHIANPGCFATAMQLALLPAAASPGTIASEINITGITGSTGAGQNPSATTHFSWRSSNLSIYKPFTHQHLGEVRETLSKLGCTREVNFVPVRGDFPRGILASVYFDTPLEEEAAVDLYKSYYNSSPFVTVSPFNPDLKMVVGTNRCVLYIKKYGSKLHVISMIDNLLKGASGQAVQNMNLLFGLGETTGLELKAQRF